MNDATHYPRNTGDVELSFTYKNWKGRTAERTVIHPNMIFKENEYHDGPQWFLVAFDKERNAWRDFALADILTPLRQSRTITNPCNFSGGDHE